MASLNTVIPTVALTSLPITGSTTSNRLADSSLATLSTSNQPVFFGFDGTDIVSIDRFGPSRLSCRTSGIVKSGRLKISGTTFTRLEVEVVASRSINELSFDLKNEILEYFGLTTLNSSISLARVERVYGEDIEYDISGYSLYDNQYDLLYAKEDSSVAQLSFHLNATTTNNSISLSSSDKVTVVCLVYTNNDFEELYFSEDQIVITNKLFARIDRISISSGFRSSVGSIVGSVSIEPYNQPLVGTSYSVDYSFTAPKEGERITIKYNTNNLIADVTSSVEEVRPITADVLVKEAFEITVDVEGEILVNEDAEDSETQIIENVINAIINLLNTNRLGSIIDYSDIISVATSVTGVDSINISLFNETGKQGRRSFIKSLDNQTITAGSVIITSVPRKDFRIS